MLHDFWETAKGVIALILAIALAVGLAIGDKLLTYWLQATTFKNVMGW